MSSWFKGKVAVVTGGASGLGQAVAAQLLEAGAKVTIVDRNQAALDRAVKELRSDSLIGVLADVSLEEDVDRYVFETVTRFGGIDLFHNNAGITGPLGQLIDFTVEGYRQVFDVNVLGVLLGMKAVAKAMLAGGGGNIVNTGSVTAIRSAKDSSIYGASKAAVQRLTQHAAVEWGPNGIRVNAAERALRGIALGRRNWTFAGSQRGAERAAVMLTLITTSRLNDVDPQAWLADVLARIADLPVSRLHELLPWEWKRLRQAEKPADPPSIAA